MTGALSELCELYDFTNDRTGGHQRVCVLEAFLACPPFDEYACAYAHGSCRKGDKFLIEELYQIDNFINDRMNRTFVRPGVGYYSGMHWIDENITRSTAMRCADMPYWCGPLHMQSLYLSVPLEYDTSRLNPATLNGTIEELDLIDSEDLIVKENKEGMDYNKTEDVRVC